jgi:PAS domain S-box-containing protein
VVIKPDSLISATPNEAWRVTQRTPASRSFRAGRFGPLLPIPTLIVFLIAIAAIVTVARVSYSALKDTVGSAQRVSNTRDVVEHLQMLLSIMKDAETGQRGFLLTDDENYVGPYLNAKATLADEIATVRALVADDLQQQRRLQALEQLCADKMAELAQTIALVRQGDPTATLAIVHTNRGNALMERIRTATAAMMGEERRLLAVHQAEWLGASRDSSFVTVAGAAFLLALIVVLAFSMSRNYQARQIRIWVRTGQIALSERIQGDQRLEKLADRVLGFLAEYLGVQAGAVYLAELDGGFRRFAGYAVAGEPDLDLMRSGDGFLGQAAHENRALHLKAVPEDYMPVGSSLGRSRPIELFVAPASVDGVVYAVIELVFSRRLEAPDHTFLARAFQSLGVAVRSSKDRSRLEVVLEAAQRQGEQLAQTNLQLEQQALVLKRQKDELSMFNSANFSSIATDAKGVIQIFNVGAERMLGYTAEEVVHKITPADFSDAQEVIARAKALSVELETPIAPGFEALVFKASRGIEDIYELTYIRKDGRRFPVVVSVTTLRDAEDAIIGYLLIGTDNSARKRAEEDLLNAGALQRAIFQSANFSKIATDANGVIQIFNVGAERMLGYTAAEVVNKITPADISDPQEIIARAKALSVELETPIAPGFEALVFKASRGIEDIYELTYIRKDGSRFPAVVSVTALRDAEGATIGYLLIGTDNTARKRAEEALVKAGALQSAIFNSANFSSIATDANGVIQIFNVGAERMLGYTAEEVVNKITPADISDPLELIARAEALSIELETPIAPGFEALVFKASRGIEDIYELTYIRKDGGRFPAVVSVKGLRDAEGAIIGYLMIGTDNTARKQIEAEQAQLGQRLRDHQFYTRSLFESNIDALMTTDAPGIITDVNKQMEALTGCTRDELIGAPFKTFFTDPERAEAGISLALSKRKVTDYELTARDRDGKETVVSYNATTLYDRDRKLQGVFAAVREITERKQYERSLREATRRAEHANSAKSEFLANMSHEIRTPLNAVIGLGYLLEHTTLNEDQRQLLSKIQFGGRALLGVINNVLDLSKIEAGEMSLEDEPFDLPELVRDLGQMLAPQAAAKTIELIVQCAPAMPRIVKGDASRLRQILTNLLGNSIKFTESGHVELKVFCTEQSSDRIRLRCTVQDTGMGIESAALERLFTPFTQADASTTRRFGGTGLGLSIARRFVDLMGGEIGVTSTVAVGSTFWIEIPLRIAHDIDGMPSAHGLSILVVDSGGDSPERLLTMARALGWSPKVAETGEQLLATMSSTRPNAWPDVLILELHLDDMDAHQLIARLEKECGHGALPPVIVVADLAQSYMDHEQLMRTTDVMLVRPLTSSALFNAVNAVVSKRPDSLERVLQSTNFDELRAQWLAGVRVLVVDDSDINLEVAQRILEKQGAIVTTCSDGLAALEQVRAHHQILDVVLMDVQMPALDGNEATRRIRGELQLTLPIVALTAGALVGERLRALEAGMNDFISKPFDPQALIRKVRRLVEQARGEPIAMVILDAETTCSATAGPLMASIDAGVVQQMFGDDLPMFKSLLARMLREFADLALPISVSPDDRTARSEIQGRTHKLKGSAGMIGATKVMRLAGAAEIALQESRPADIVEGILKQLALAITTLREEAAGFLDRPEPVAGTGAEVVTRPNIGNADIEELCTLLECQNLAAIDKFALLSASLSELVGAVRFDRLHDAIDNLNFQLGAELLRETLLVGRHEKGVKARQG